METIEEYLVRAAKLKQVKLPKHLKEEADKKAEEYLFCVPRLDRIGILKSIFLRKRKVYQFGLDGSFIKEWDSISEVEDKLGFNHSGVIQCCKNEVTSYKRFIWKYRDSKEYNIEDVTLPGIEFGKWRVIGEEVKDGRILCKCNCHRGIEREVLLDKLLLGVSTNCGCESSRVIYAEDLVDQEFGRLKVLESLGISQEGGRYYYLCKCGCGREIKTYREALLSGEKTECEVCFNPYAKKRDVLIGKKFGRLTITAFEVIREGRKNTTMTICDCDCGKRGLKIWFESIKSGHTQSCGCWNRESSSLRGIEKAKNHFKAQREWYYIKEGVKTPVKSALEVIMASYLISKGIKFEYESKVFWLEDGRRYLPDFYIPDQDLYIETKGFFISGNPRQKETIELFSKDHKLKLMFTEDVEKFCELPKKIHYYTYQAKKNKVPLEDYLPTIFNK